MKLDNAENRGELLAGMAVLIADDHLLFRNLIVEACCAAGFGRQDAVASGSMVQAAVAQRLAAGSAYAAVFLDWNMPPPAGPELVAHLRSLSAYDKTPIFMVTSEGEIPAAIAAVRAGATGYVIKPVSREALAIQVNRVIELIVSGWSVKD